MGAEPRHLQPGVPPAAPQPFEAAFAKFTAAFARAFKGVVAIDGKALRGAYERGRKTTPLHLINIWAPSPGW